MFIPLWSWKPLDLASPVPNVLTRRDEQEHNVRRGLHARGGERFVKAAHGVAPTRGACLCLQTPLVRFGEDLSFRESRGEVRVVQFGQNTVTNEPHRAHTVVKYLMFNTRTPDRGRILIEVPTVRPGADIYCRIERCGWVRVLPFDRPSGK